MKYNTLLRYTILVPGTIKLKNNTNQINSTIITKVFFHFVQKNDYHHRSIPKGITRLLWYLFLQVSGKPSSIKHSVKHLVHQSFLSHFEVSSRCCKIFMHHSHQPCTTSLLASNVSQQAMALHPMRTGFEVPLCLHQGRSQLIPFGACHRVHAHHVTGHLMHQACPKA